VIDWEQLERELADDGFETDGVGSAAARRRERRRLIVVAALAVVLLAALVVPLCVVVLRGRPGGGSGANAARSLPRSATRGPASPAADRAAASAATRAAIYAAAIAGGTPTPLAHQVWVASTVCTAVPSPPGRRRCIGRAIPAAVQRQVRAILGPRVTFASDPPVPYHAAGTVVVQLGRLVVHGNRARLGVDTLCGALCGQGGTLVLRRIDGTWRATGTVGTRWVS
jgi:hypothetical protein